MKTLIERVARALCENDGRNPDQTSDYKGTPRHLWRAWETEAKVAIAAVLGLPFDSIQ